MQGFINNIRYVAMALTAVCSMTSCVYDDLPEEQEQVGTGERSFLNIALAVPEASADSPASGSGYQDGNTYENYIDVAGGNYRICFFDEANVLIDMFLPAGFTSVNGSNYSRYEIFGFTPEKLVGRSSFKVMVLANWPVYPAVTPGQTTVDDICNSDLSKFDCLTDFDLSPTGKRLIPFYGIHKYDNVVFTKGERTTLAAPITLLRAMAKVEIVLDAAEDVRFKDVTLHRHNAQGYCAPERVYSEDDYGQGVDWTNDYLHRLHLVGGKNDADADNRKLPFRCENRKGDGKNETWIAYIPEYRNVADDGTAAKDEAYIDLHLNFQDSSKEPFRIYFADYGTGGITDTANIKRMNIERNNIYRFTVSMCDNRMEVFVRRWNYRPQPSVIL